MSHNALREFKHCNIPAPTGHHLIVLLFVAAATLSQSVTEVRELTLIPGKSISRELTAGEVHNYSLRLPASHFVSLVIEQRGIDVVVSLDDPNGKLIANGDSLSYFKVAAAVPVIFTTNADGNYRLKIRSLKREVSSGSYEIKIEELRVATRQDVLRTFPPAGRLPKAGSYIREYGPAR